MQYEDYYALELDAEMREMEEMWLNEQDEMYLDMIEEWERNFKERDWCYERNVL